jgi:hypothetical protein
MISRAVFLAGWCLCAWAQNRFDAYTLRAPAGYRMEEAQGYQEWSRINQKERYYCQIGPFRAQPSSGNAAQDAEKEWRQAVASAFKPRGDD